ncbi:hypothetical protein [Blastopirellula retiformator]|uniref:Uncharacterized protein n=1 Tax=Blastopirellula retiformator TaxID=2527970 RepID=A0A5C5VAF5_9BACT|nr:hypothetical protein [Blastopirellula retiformator]TWT34907.1 hypothetical protein Enr8_23220 [Blastopirellula retiformator]
MLFELETEGDGIKRVSHKTFEKVTLPDLMLQGTPSSPIRIQDVQFLHCRISPGTAWLGGQIELEDVLFENLDCGDALRINSECHCRRITIVGKLPKAFWVRPDDGVTLARNTTDDSIVFDISTYTGEVEIIGYAGPEVKKDAERHVSLYSHWKDEVNWQELGIGGLSFWRLALQKITSGGTGRGVFSLPTTKSKNYQKTLEQRARLEEAGLSFD